MRFDYLYTTTAMDSIDIENIGEVVLIGNTDFGKEFLLVIHTISGISHVVTWGPSYVDLEELPKKVTYSYECFEFNEKKLINIIDKWLNNVNLITQIRESTIDEAKTIVKDLLNYVATR